MVSGSNNPVPETTEEVLSVEQRWALIEQVAASDLFSRSARLRDFLLYVGKRSLREDNPEIHERDIGAKVFGRPLTYDRGSDNIVRVNASELRKRVDQWFSIHGPQQGWVFEIPRGSYKPVFHRRLADPVAEPVPEAALALPDEAPLELLSSSLPPPISPPRSRSWSRLWPIACVLLAGFCGWLMWQNHTQRKLIHPWMTEPAIASFWADFLGSERETDIILPDSSIGLSEEFTGHRVELDEYLEKTYLTSFAASNLSADRKSDLDQLFRHNLVTFGDLRAAREILTLDPLSSSLRLTSARSYAADSIKRNNVILIGGRKANPWVFLFDHQMNFSLDQDDGTQTMYVINHNPRAGEQSYYRESSSPEGSIGYSVIAYLPNPSSKGDAIIFAGTGSNATNAAAEFLTSEEQMESLRRTFGVSRLPYFEVLLQASQLSGTSFGVKVIAYRTYPKGNR